MRFLCLILTAAFAAPLGGGRQATPARDLLAAPTSGTSSVSGVVVNDESPAKPVRRAIVSLSGPDLRPSRSAITDDDGRFVVSGLPAGQITVTASRAGFITSIYGANRPGRAGKGVVVGVGQVVGPLTVRIWRGAAIAGTLRDESGQLAPGVVVTAIPARSFSSGVFTLTGNSVKTTDTGEFRIFGLEPGAYVIAARPSSGGGPTETMTEREVDAILESLARQAQPGGATISPATQTRPPTSTYAPVYYPGTASLAQAQPFTIAAGQEQAGVDFRLVRVPTVQIDGRITTSDGQPAAGASIQITAVAEGVLFASGSPLSMTATSAADGSFRIFQVTPGAYRLVARFVLPAGPTPDPRVNNSRSSVGLPSLWATADLLVSGDDISGLSLIAEPGVRITGRFSVAGGSPPAPDFSGFKVQLLLPALASSRGPVPVSDISFALPVAARPDGTFEVTNIAPGTYVFRAFAPVTGTALAPRSALLGDREILDEPIEVSKTWTGEAISIVLSDQHSELSGSIQTGAGGLPADLYVIAFAEDRKYWAVSRRVQAVRPDAEGLFSIKDLPAGVYRLATVTNIDPEDWKETVLLERLVPASLRVSITDGGKTVQNLRAGGG